MKKNTEVCEEIEFVCPQCKRSIKMVKDKKTSTEGLLCQRCGLGKQKS